MKQRKAAELGETLLEHGLRIAVTVALVMVGIAVGAEGHAQQGGVLNLYSARHYQTDEALYSNFTKQTGIKINRIELGDEQLLQRLRSEGANSPADVVLLVDAARLWSAQSDGLFQVTRSKALEERIPAHLRSSDSTWFGFSTRARVIVYNRDLVKREDVDTYEELADPKNKGKVCTRSGSHPYMLSLLGSIVERSGDQAAESWARGMVANMARAPKGGDTDQIKGVAAGECGVALTNSYYWARILRSQDAKERDIVRNVGFVWPNQSTSGTHVNVSGGAVAKNAPNQANAVAFLEYLSGAEAQSYFANGNNEWPTVKGVAVANDVLESLGKFKADEMPISAIGKSIVPAQKILDRAGYK